MSIELHPWMFPLWRRMRLLKTGVMLSVRPTAEHACMHPGYLLVKNSENEGLIHISVSPFFSSLISIMQFRLIPFQKRGKVEDMAFSPSVSMHRTVCPARSSVVPCSRSEGTTTTRRRRGMPAPPRLPDYRQPTCCLLCRGK